MTRTARFFACGAVAAGLVAGMACSPVDNVKAYRQLAAKVRGEKDQDRLWRRLFECLQEAVSRLGIEVIDFIENGDLVTSTGWFERKFGSGFLH